MRPAGPRLARTAALLGVLLSCVVPTARAADADARAGERARMVRTQIEARGITTPRVLGAMRAVPRHRFIPADEQKDAYADHPLPIGERQTISQPYIVAYMTDALRLEPDDRVLEIGTGSGYQAAVLAELADEVYSIEIVAPLAARAKRTLGELGYENLHLRTGDGYQGWPEAAPFDAILVTAAAKRLPRGLLDQLAPGGRMIVPLEAKAGTPAPAHWLRPEQVLMRIDKAADGSHSQRVLLPVAFVPLIKPPKQSR